MFIDIPLLSDNIDAAVSFDISNPLLGITPVVRGATALVVPSVASCQLQFVQPRFFDRLIMLTRFGISGNPPSGACPVLPAFATLTAAVGAARAVLEEAGRLFINPGMLSNVRAYDWTAETALELRPQARPSACRTVD